MLIDGFPSGCVQTFTVSTGVSTLSANFAGPNNDQGIVCQVVSGAINFTIQGGAGTPGTTDFYAGLYDFFAVKPGGRLRMVRNGGTDATVKVQVVE